MTVEVHVPFSPLPPATHNLSPLGIQQEEISVQRKRAGEAQLSQAERMVKRSRVTLKAREIGNNVAVPIPMVDRGKGDPRNTIGVIVDRSDNDM